MNTQLICIIGGNGVLLVLVLYIMIFTYRKTAAVKQWPSTMGIVFKTAVERRLSRRHYVNYAIVKYSYQVGERTYQNAKVSLGSAASGKDAKRVVARYPVGAQVMVFYNPQNPSEAVLERKNSTQLAILWLTLIIVISMSYTMIQVMLRVPQP